MGMLYSLYGNDYEDLSGCLIASQILQAEMEGSIPVTEDVDEALLVFKAIHHQL